MGGWVLVSGFLIGEFWDDGMGMGKERDLVETCRVLYMILLSFRDVTLYVQEGTHIYVYRYIHSMRGDESIASELLEYYVPQ